MAEPLDPLDSDASCARPIPLTIGSQTLPVSSVIAIARGDCGEIALDHDPDFLARLKSSQCAVETGLAAGGQIYGVTTGVGASVGNQIPAELQDQLPHNLLRFHGCGTGRILDETEAAAVTVVRLASLVQGHSGVRPIVVQRLCDLINHRLLPRIPCEGSVGASGDLTPLSYLAATLVGDREVTYQGEIVAASEALERAGLEPLSLQPKESLALMNGTSVMTALGCLAWERALKLSRLASAVSAMVSETTHGNPGHFDARIFDWKPHPGSRLCAEWLRADLDRDDEGREPARLQDRYSIRCAPHVIGVLIEVAQQAERVLEIEVNGANDNPLVDPESGEILHGGNFYGGHICMAMDSLKTAVASVADLLDRQLPLLCCPATSDGLPENLIAATGPEAVIHHGFKAMQISASALTAEALKLTMPASAFSRSTESHNQDKVSMGTIAARDCLRVLELSETVAAIALLAACQAVDIREREGERPGHRAAAMRNAIRKSIPELLADRRQDGDIARVVEMHHADTLPIGELKSD